VAPVVPLETPPVADVPPLVAEELDDEAVVLVWVVAVLVVPVVGSDGAVAPVGTVNDGAPAVSVEPEPPPPQPARPAASAAHAATAADVFAIEAMLRSRAAPFVCRSADSR
jgi:hypothetical protein